MVQVLLCGACIAMKKQEKIDGIDRRRRGRLFSRKLVFPNYEGIKYEVKKRRAKRVRRKCIGV